MCLAQVWTLRLRLVPQGRVRVTGVRWWLLAGVVGSMEVANAVVVGGYRMTLRGMSGPLRWLRERRL
jgi:hypothetical protein